VRGAVVGVVLGVLLGFGLDDPEDRVTTVTETVEVEVPGPEVVRYERVPLPDSCARMIPILDDAYANMLGYSTSTASDTANINEAIAGVTRGDFVRINQSLDDMHTLEFEAMEWVRAFDDNIEELAELQPQCAADVED